MRHWLLPSVNNVSDAAPSTDEGPLSAGADVVDVFGDLSLIRLPAVIESSCWRLNWRNLSAVEVLVAVLVVVVEVDKLAGVEVVELRESNLLSKILLAAAVVEVDLYCSTVAVTGLAVVVISLDVVGRVSS